MEPAFIPNFAALRQLTNSSDVNVLVAVEAQGAPSPAGSLPSCVARSTTGQVDGSQTVNVHKAVLMGFSSWFASKVCPSGLASCIMIRLCDTPVCAGTRYVQQQLHTTALICFLVHCLP